MRTLLVFADGHHQEIELAAGYGSDSATAHELVLISLAAERAVLLDSNAKLIKVSAVDLALVVTSQRKSRDW